jgi:hypothetical protein
LIHFNRHALPGRGRASRRACRSTRRADTTTRALPHQRARASPMPDEAPVTQTRRSATSRLPRSGILTGIQHRAHRCQRRGQAWRNSTPDPLAHRRWQFLFSNPE